MIANETINEKTKLLKPKIYGARGIIAPMAKDINDEIAANLAEGKSLVETPNSSKE